MWAPLQREGGQLRLDVVKPYSAVTLEDLWGWNQEKGVGRSSAGRNKTTVLLFLFPTPSWDQEADTMKQSFLN